MRSFGRAALKIKYPCRCRGSRRRALKGVEYKYHVSGVHFSTFPQMKPLLSDSLFKQPRSIFAGTKIDQITYAGGRLKKNVGLRSLIRLFKALKLLNVVVYLFTFFSWSSKKEASHLLGTNWLPKTWATWATWPTKDKKLRNPTHRHTRTHGRTHTHNLCNQCDPTPYSAFWF